MRTGIRPTAENGYGASEAPIRAFNGLVHNLRISPGACLAKARGAICVATAAIDGEHRRDSPLLAPDAAVPLCRMEPCLTGRSNSPDLRIIVDGAPALGDHIWMYPIHYHRVAVAVALSIPWGCGRVDPTQDGDAADPPALIKVAERGDISALNALLGDNAPPDARDACRWTPLMKAALYGHLPVVERLLNAGADPSAEDKGGYTPVMLAASNNHTQVIERLVEHGAGVNHQEHTQGWTALIWAARNGHGESVAVLLGHGTDPGLRDTTGRNAADWARELGHAQVLAALPGGTGAPARL